MMNNSKNRPQDPNRMPRFAGITTFSRLPYQPEFAKNSVDVAILGVPTDAGTSYRAGARFGPRAIRESSVMNRNFNPTISVNIYDKLSIVDAGDVEVNPVNLKKTLQATESHVTKLKKLGAKVISLGGDHSIMYPLLRAHHALDGDFTLVHFDAHTDTGDEAWGEKFHHGTPVRRLIEEKIIDPKKTFQIGIRGPLGSDDQYEWVEKQGISMLTMDEFHIPGAREKFFDRIRKMTGKGKVYVTFDVDGIDPAYAPGTGTPVVGGLTSLEALQCVRALKGLNLMGADVVEVSPAYDHSDITSLLASALVFEFLSLIAVKS